MRTNKIHPFPPPNTHISNYQLENQASDQFPLVRDGRRVDQILLLCIFARLSIPLDAERLEEVLESPLIFVGGDDQDGITMIVPDEEDLVGGSALCNFDGDLVGSDQNVIVFALLEGSSADDELGAALFASDDGGSVGVPEEIGDEFVADEECTTVEPLDDGRSAQNSTSGGQHGKARFARTSEPSTMLLMIGQVRVPLVSLRRVAMTL